MEGFDDFGFGIHFTDEQSFQAAPPPRLKVYLASAMTNTTSEATSEAVLVRFVCAEVLAKAGCCSYSFDLYDPASVSFVGSSHTPAEVYELDHWATLQSDVVFFHANYPSFGVGIESQIAADATLPKVLISRQGTPVSRMVRGIFSPTLVEIIYADGADFRKQLESQIPQIATAVLQSKAGRKSVVDSIAKAQLGRYIFARRIRKRMLLNELALCTDIQSSWLARLERDDNAAQSLSLAQLLRLAKALDSTIQFGHQGSPSFVDDDGPHDTQEEKSLHSLVAYVRSSPAWITDQRLFDAWSDYCEQRRAAEFRTGPRNSAYTVDDWKEHLKGDEPKLF